MKSVFMIANSCLMLSEVEMRYVNFVLNFQNCLILLFNNFVNKIKLI